LIGKAPSLKKAFPSKKFHAKIRKENELLGANSRFYGIAI